MKFSFGQIRLDEPGGTLIYQTVIKYKPRTIVELGTWNGLGSTMCVIQALKDSKIEDTNFISVELYPDMFDEAKENLKNYKQYVNVLNGRIVDYNDVFWFDHEIINFNEDEHARLYFEKDLEYLKSQQSVLNEIPEHIDLLILDGGEYSTYPEWLKLKNRTSTVVLDDTKTLKCSKIRKEILLENEFVTVYDNLSTRNGFSIFTKIK
jgi:hypothetical protein